jgi:hypothetical protein
MSAKEIVAKLRAMAADPSHRTNLIKEPGTIPTLIVSLADTDTDISFTALEVRIIENPGSTALVGWNASQSQEGPNLIANEITAISPISIEPLGFG